MESCCQVLSDMRSDTCIQNVSGMQLCFSSCHQQVAIFIVTLTYVVRLIDVGVVKALYLYMLRHTLNRITWHSMASTSALDCNTSTSIQSSIVFEFV